MKESRDDCIPTEPYHGKASHYALLTRARQHQYSSQPLRMAYTPAVTPPGFS